MRILHVVNDADTGGAQTLIEALAHRRGHDDEVRILVLLGRGGLSDRLEAAATSVDYVGMSRKEVLPLRAVAHLLRLVRKHRIDVVHSHLHQSDLVNAITPHGRPRISTQHASEDASSSKVAHAAWRAAGLASFRMDEMVACSPSARNITAEFGYTFPPERMPVIFNGTTVTDAPSPNPGGQQLLHLARFAPPKDHRNLLEAMARVHEKHPEAHLLCAGNGVDESNTELTTWRKELGLDGVVEFAGTITDVRRRLRTSTALVFASYNEALPMAGLEAISEGLPVITTRAGDAAFMTVDEHLAVAPRDPEALAAAIDWFLTRTPEQVDALRQSSWELSRRDFDIDRAAQRYITIYRDLVSS
ncbi:glycosyltransferase [Kocuria sp. JC486]|uniref:glycosyltransferase n=1 Tax=Kocuria sp. JC486 TaxID=1970736 RepID=UPI00141E769B|nr:glycosyltransferase [Kocuria sp. JC486]NHU85006.1 glycosyltransferase [Kocuria sp. JC486]